MLEKSKEWFKNHEQTIEVASGWIVASFGMAVGFYMGFKCRAKVDGGILAAYERDGFLQWTDPDSGCSIPVGFAAELIEKFYNKKWIKK